MPYLPRTQGFRLIKDHKYLKQYQLHQLRFAVKAHSDKLE